MPNSLRDDLLSVPVRSLDNIGPGSDRVGPGAAKAVLRSDQRISSVIRAAVVKHYGSVKEAAWALGEVDPSLMNREFDAGKFSRIDEHADADCKAAISRALYYAFGSDDPKVIRRKRIVELLTLILDEEVA
jgi:hypothetical protein